MQNGDAVENWVDLILHFTFGWLVLFSINQLEMCHALLLLISWEDISRFENKYIHAFQIPNT